MNILYQIIGWVTAIGLFVVVLRLIPIVFQIFLWIISTTVVVALVLTLVVLGLLWWLRD